MNQLVESLRRLYRDHKISKESVVRMFENKKITDIEILMQL